DFWRLRIGIDHPGNAKQVVDYVLGRPSRDDADDIEREIARTEELLPRIVAGESQKVMNLLHASR
ncbi:MAG: aminoacyl-tRNA hydrolase, partial [Candidatus Sedimenticola sp. PURPLELP]